MLEDWIWIHMQDSLIEGVLLEEDWGTIVQETEVLLEEDWGTIEQETEVLLEEDWGTIV